MNLPEIEGIINDIDHDITNKIDNIGITAIIYI